MKPCKATGPDDLAADVWKSKLWYPAEWLVEFFNQVVKENEVPHNSATIPIWKKKGSPTGCTNYCPIRLLLHSMKIPLRFQLSILYWGAPGFCTFSSPLFVVMDAITRDLQKPVPWTLFHAEDVMLACKDKDDLER
ncbi:unnamed protein product [Heligmosomoides polygyrus]|uniref:Reverse transcriptase domain-containing protein n=1 Tax=Heligmosomoides polygyrus TaxID=6339 RepID=A0A183GXF8_HELPZ|nr:unnamed protein product [Heligmosomoides polygyrus]